MLQAVETGQPSMSGALGGAKPFDGNGLRSSLLVMPVYRTKAQPATLDERRRAIIGYVFSPFSPHEVLRQAIASTAPGVAFELYDETEKDRARLTPQSGPDPDTSQYKSSGLVEIGGHDWLVVISAPDWTGEPALAKWMAPPCWAGSCCRSCCSP